MDHAYSIMDLLDIQQIIILAVGLAVLVVLLWSFSSLQHKWSAPMSKRERQSWFEEMFEEVNKEVDAYNCKKISIALFEEVINSFEASGRSLDDIDIDVIITEAIAMNPNLKERAPH